MSPKHPYFWVVSAAISGVVIIEIEIIRLCLHCDGCGVVNSVCNVIEGIAFSYIAAAIFQWIVVYIPNQKRKEMMKPLIDLKLGNIRESLRECKTIPNPYTFGNGGKQQSKAEFQDKFSKCNLLDDYMIQGFSKLDRINTLKGKIEQSVDVLLSNKEYLTDSQFDFANKIIASNFMQNMLVPNDEVCDENSKNQDMMGECIYDLFEEAKAVCI